MRPLPIVAITLAACAVRPAPYPLSPARYRSAYTYIRADRCTPDLTALGRQCTVGVYKTQVYLRRSAFSVGPPSDSTLSQEMAQMGHFQPASLEPVFGPRTTSPADVGIYFGAPSGDTLLAEAITPFDPEAVYPYVFAHHTSVAYLMRIDAKGNILSVRSTRIVYD